MKIIHYFFPKESKLINIIQMSTPVIYDCIKDYSHMHLPQALRFYVWTAFNILKRKLSVCETEYLLPWCPVPTTFGWRFSPSQSCNTNHHRLPCLIPRDVRKWERWTQKNGGGESSEGRKCRTERKIALLQGPCSHLLTLMDDAKSSKFSFVF